MLKLCPPISVVIPPVYGVVSFHHYLGQYIDLFWVGLQKIMISWPTNHYKNCSIDFLPVPALVLSDMMVWPPEVFEMVGGYHFTTIGVLRACCEWHGDDDRLTVVTAVLQWLLRAGGWVDRTHRLMMMTMMIDWQLWPLCCSDCYVLVVEWMEHISWWWW